MIATWFGPDDVPLFGCWHLPEDGRARGVAVLCSSLGREQDVGHRAIRFLAERLAEQGIAALRFDYAATADSADVADDPDGEGLVAAWLDSVETAVEHARASGAEHVTLVGLRMGALLAGLVQERRPVADAVVAWDPCASGAAFLREERALRRLSLPDVPVEVEECGVEAYGAVYSARTAADLRPLRLPSSTAVPTLLVLRDDRPVAGEAEELAARPAVTSTTTDEQGQLLDVTDVYALLPVDTAARIAAWVADTAPADTRPVRVGRRTSATVGEVDGVPVTEDIVDLGPRRLFGIVSRGPLPSSSAVLFAPTATHYHPGVGRSAVDLGRRLAASGVSSVRYDTLDLGDSPDGASPDGPRYYTEDATRDAADAVTAVRELCGGDVALVGLCSGSWAAATVVPRVRPTAVYLLNPIVWARRPVAMGPVERTDPSLLASTFDVAQRIPGLASAGVLAWRTLATAGLVDGPATMIDAEGCRATRITVLLGPEEARVFGRKVAFGSARRLARREHLRFVTSELPDHGMLTVALRREVGALLPELIAQDLSGSGVPAP